MTKLALQSIGGLLFLIAVLGAILFGIAGTFNYPEAWIYLGEFFICTSLVTLYLWVKDQELLKRRTKAGPVAEKETKQKVIQSFASLSFIGIFVLCAYDHIHWTRNRSHTAEITGDVLVVLGFLFVFLVFRENTFTAATIEVNAGQKVVDSGPYALVRHPMYAGASVLLIGTPLSLGSLYGLLMVIPMIAVITWRLLDEEKLLKKDLAGYEAYCIKVKWRLLPFVW